MSEEKRQKLDHVQGFIFGDGTIISKEEAAKIFRSQKDELTQSTQIEAEEEKEWSSAEGAIKPPYVFGNLIKMLEVSTYHYRCVKAKGMDTAGLGHHIIEDPENKGVGKPEDKKRLEAFFNNCNPNMEFVDVLDQVLVDYEATGNGFFELARNRAGELKYIYHLPSKYTRVREKGGYVQIVGSETVYFQQWGEKYPDASEEKFGRPHFMNKESGKYAANMRHNGVKTANEVLHLKNYHPGSYYYGLPDFLPSVGAIAGNVSARDFNISFFDNRGVPAYAIIIKGAKLDPELRTLIETFFQSKLKGSAHRTLVMPVPSKSVEVHFEKLSSEISESSFKDYMASNRDEIIVSHGMHPARIGIIATASLGSGTGTSQSETYKNSIIEPRQRRLEFLINHRIIQEGLRVRGWVFKFEDLDVRNRTAEVNNAKAMLDRAAYTVNEVRQQILKLDKVDGGDRAFIKLGNSIVFLDNLQVAEVKPQSASKGVTLDDLAQAVVNASANQPEEES